MASLAPPFILCPLAESKEFLGISGDQVENKVIISIGKNIAIRYHVSEQKQEVSWASSRHWLTSRVVYCSDLQKYGSAIDHSMVGLWDENDSNLTSMKKYKYSDPIFELKPTKLMGTLVIFKTGRVELFSQNQSKEKKDSNQKRYLDEKVEEIISSEVDESSKHIFLLCGTAPCGKAQTSSKCGVKKMQNIKVVTFNLERETTESSLETHPVKSKFVHAVQIRPKSDESILGACVMPNGTDSFLVYICDDGYLYRQRLIPENSTNIEEASGDRISNLGKYVSTSNPVVLKFLDPATLIVFGCDASEEGAIVFIFDINYDLVLSKQSLKLYSIPPIMEKVGLSVFVPVGLHILVLGLRITKSLLSSVLGRHQLRSLDFFETRDPWGKGWGEEEDNGEEESNIETTGFEDLVKLVKTLENHGHPQSVICGQVIPSILENRNLPAMKWSLEYFSDMPEPFIMAMLTLLLNSMEKTEVLSSSSDIDEETVEHKSVYPTHPQMEQILQRPFEQKEMIRSLRTMDFNTVKKFVDYLCQQLDAPSSLDLDDADEYSSRVSNLMKWLCTILDAHYAQFVFHNEIGIVDSLLGMVEEKMQIMREIEDLEPYLVSTIAKVSFQPAPSPNSRYRTERVIFE